jgi:hypothetical protein
MFTFFALFSWINIYADNFDVAFVAKTKGFIESNRRYQAVDPGKVLLVLRIEGLMIRDVLVDVLGEERPYLETADSKVNVQKVSYESEYSGITPWILLFFPVSEDQPESILRIRNQPPVELSLPIQAMEELYEREIINEALSKVKNIQEEDSSKDVTALSKSLNPECPCWTESLLERLPQKTPGGLWNCSAGDDYYWGGHCIAGMEGCENKSFQIMVDLRKKSNLCNLLCYRAGPNSLCDLEYAIYIDSLTPEQYSACVELLLKFDTARNLNCFNQ